MVGIKRLVFAQSSTETKTQQTFPTLLIRQQLDTPLQITSAAFDNTDANVLQIRFLLENKSPKTISAYTLTQELEGNNRQDKDFSLVNILSPEGALVANVNKKGRLVVNDILAIKILTLSVDFVEFTDGTIWGLDKGKSAERLAGQRAGAKAVKDSLAKTSSVNLLAFLSQSAPSIQLPEEQSQEWNEGFQTGVTITLDRLRHSYERGGYKELEKTRALPFDAAEGRQK